MSGQFRADPIIWTQTPSEGTNIQGKNVSFIAYAAQLSDYKALCLPAS